MALAIDGPEGGSLVAAAHTRLAPAFAAAGDDEAAVHHAREVK